MSAITQKDANKIIVLGLAESGKSTIIKAVTVGEIPERGARYNATMNYERKVTTILGKKLTLFDLGGQTSFLDRFTGELAEFVFSGVSAFIFVVDSTKFEEVSRAKYYLDLCLKNLEKHSPKSRKNVFLHKSDLLNASMVEQISLQVKEYLLSDYSGQFDFYMTSVYSDSLFEAVGSIFKQAGDEDKQTFDSVLNSFIEVNNNIMTFGSLYAKDGNAVVHVDVEPQPTNFSIVQTLYAAKSLINEFRSSLDDPPLSFSLESQNELFIIRRLSNEVNLVLGFSKPKMKQNRETLSTVNNKIITLAQQLSDISL